MKLVPIDRQGTLPDHSAALPELAESVLAATAELYAKVGFEEPWVGYLAILDEVPVGTCGFKSPPREGRVEIAYFTFPDFEGQGVASDMAAQLLAMAQENDPALVVAAQTLPTRNASHRVLEKLGFRHIETQNHPEDGTVWEWHWDATAGEETSS